MRQTIMLMAACAALLASCTNEVGEGLGVDTPIQVTASVEGALTTRTDNSTESLTEFGLSIKDGQSYDGDYAGENIKVSKPEDASAWTLADEVLYKGSGQSYFAYAPYNADMAKGATTYAFSVRADQSAEGAMQASDLLHAAAIQLPKPELCASYDMDPEKSVQTRRRFLDLAADAKRPLAGMHLPAPGIVHIHRSGNGYAATSR